MVSGHLCVVRDHGMINLINSIGKQPILILKMMLTNVSSRRQPVCVHKHTQTVCPLLCSSCRFCGHSRYTLRPWLSCLSYTWSPRQEKQRRLPHTTCLHSAYTGGCTLSTGCGDTTLKDSTTGYPLLLAACRHYSTAISSISTSLKVSALVIVLCWSVTLTWVETHSTWCR